MWSTKGMRCRYGGREIAKGELTFTQMLKVWQLAMTTVHCIAQQCMVHAPEHALQFSPMCYQSGDSLSCHATLGMTDYQ